MASPSLSSPRPVLLGVEAGLGLALVDLLASGLLRTPWQLHLLSFAVFGLAGLAAGLLARPLPRLPNLAFALTFFAGSLLGGVSLLSKQIGTGPLLLPCVAALVISLVASLICLGPKFSLHQGASAGGRLTVLASIPAAALVASHFGVELSGLLLCLCVPVFVALVVCSLPLTDWKIESGLAAAVCLVLTLPVRLGDANETRADLAPTLATAAPDAPDLLLVIVDTMRADALQLDGRGVLSKLAAEGVVFDQCVSAAPWTLPSVSSILTGLLPSQHGAVDASRILSDDVSTLAEQLRDRGYQTAAFTGGAFVSTTFQLDQGFEHFDDSAEFGFRPYRLHTPLIWRLAKNRFLASDGMLDWVDEFPAFDGVCDGATAWLQKREVDRPYFLVLHTYEIHDYFVHHAGTDAGIQRGDFDLSERFGKRLSVHPSELEGATQGDLDYFHAIYSTRMDHVEQRLGVFLEQLGLVDQRPRVLAVVSDHGEGFDAERGRVNHGGRLQDDLLHVPLLLHSTDGVARGARVAEQVRSIDLVPTFLELAGAQAPADVTGISLVGALRGEPLPKVEAWSEERANGRDLVSLRSLPWKLLTEGGEQQHFDLGQDPFEDRATLGAPGELRDRLLEFSVLFPGREGEQSSIGEAAARHLEKLGYLE